MGFLDFLKKVRPVEEHRIAEVYFLCWTLPCAWKRMSQARPRSPRYPGNLPRYSAKTNISTYSIEPPSKQGHHSGS